MITEQRVQTTAGEDIILNIDTICVHGDTPGAAQIAQKLRDSLEVAGVTLSALASW